MKRFKYLLILNLGAFLMGCTERDSPPAASEKKPESQTITQRKEQIMAERAGVITMKGNPLTLMGNPVKIGEKAPDFTALKTDLSEFKFSATNGKTRIISAVPSLDTSVCATSTRRFNEEAAQLRDDIQIITISMDLPFAQQRWCAAEGISKVVVVSDHRDANFGQNWGELIKELRLLGRAVFVVDKQGKIIYMEQVKDISNEPNYQAALEAARKAS